MVREIISNWLMGDAIVICGYVDKRYVCYLLTATAGNHIDVPKTRFITVEIKLKPETPFDYVCYLKQIYGRIFFNIINKYTFFPSYFSNVEK